MSSKTTPGDTRLDPSEVHAIAAEVAAALAETRQIEPLSSRGRELTEADAYRVVAAMRSLRGGRLVGRKIGFTNYDMWKSFGVSSPIWGDVTDRTLQDLSDYAVTGFPANSLCEPRLEPEIAFGLAAAPLPGMSQDEIATCISWVAPAFEAVQSIYPGWTFSFTDSIVCGGLHGRLLLGPKVPREEVLLDRLPDLELRLFRDGELVEIGRGANVLDSPLNALRHLVDALASDPDNPPLSAGDVITTGTLTLAWPVAPSQVWRAEIAKAPFSSIELRYV